MASANVDLFDQYFKRADLDRDGRITGAEAVAFFQGSNLAKPVLAQVFLKLNISFPMIINYELCIEFWIGV